MTCFHFTHCRRSLTVFKRTLGIRCHTYSEWKKWGFLHSQHVYGLFNCVWSSSVTSVACSLHAPKRVYCAHKMCVSLWQLTREIGSVDKLQSINIWIHTLNVWGRTGVCNQSLVEGLKKRAHFKLLKSSCFASISRQSRQNVTKRDKTQTEGCGTFETLCGVSLGSSVLLLCHRRPCFGWNIQLGFEIFTILEWHKSQSD